MLTERKTEKKNVDGKGMKNDEKNFPKQDSTLISFYRLSLTSGKKSRGFFRGHRHSVVGFTREARQTRLYAGSRFYPRVIDVSINEIE